jgi:hypothetical protein
MGLNTSFTYKVVFQIKDWYKKINANSSVTVFVCAAGTANPMTITDLNGAALTNPATFSTGLVMFQFTNATSAEETGVDVYGLTAW